MRICIATDNASARFGGEAILPLHYFRFLRARGLEVWLVAHERVQAELEALLPGERHRMRFIQDHFLHRLFVRIGERLPRRVAESLLGPLTTLLTQFAQRGIIRRLVADHGVELLHQPTPVAARYPSVLSGLGIPLVIGPMNGGMEYPPAFRSEDSLASRIFVAIARQVSELSNILLPGKRSASVLLVANRRTQKALPRAARGRILQVVENGVDTAEWASHAGPDVGSIPASANGTALATRPRFVFMGRLVDWKSLQFVLEALALVPGADLDVIGDGPMLEPWQQFANTLGIAERVRFHGWLSQKECAVHLRSATALVLPSIYECGGAVVLEAMAMGRPVIATGWGGPVDYLDSSCGILVPPDSRETLVGGFADAMNTLASDPALCRRLGSAAHQRVLDHFTWEKKIDQMMDVYRLALSETSRPAEHL